ncbi:redoxin domain-containing protein [bacterium]|nr:redoxin domain-containing protein [bacterium]
MKYVLISGGLLVSLAVLAFVLVGCISTVPAGGGSKSASGVERDPSEILPVGVEAPDFEETDQNGNVVKLSDFAGKNNVVLIFYPGDMTPGCTKQLCTARDDYSKYQNLDAVVFGVNPAGAGSHMNFAERYEFPFPLLADEDGSMVRHYGCRGIGGITTRTVYVIDKEGKIVFAERGMPSTHTILESLK